MRSMRVASLPFVDVWVAADVVDTTQPQVKWTAEAEMGLILSSLHLAVHRCVTTSLMPKRGFDGVRRVTMVRSEIPMHLQSNRRIPHRHPSQLQQALNEHAQRLIMLFVVVLAFAIRPTVTFAQDGTLPIQPLFGSCLDAQWVRDTEKQLGVSASSVDELGRLVHPSLHSAHRVPRHRVEDPRTKSRHAYSANCMPKDSFFQGINATFDVNGRLVSSGNADGALVIELNLWASQTLTSFVFAIIASEIAGLPIAFFLYNDIHTTERMSSTKTGPCNPVHINLEVWTDTLQGEYCSNESYLAGENGYRGLSGVYTTREFNAKGQNQSLFAQPFDADFWRDYTSNDLLIEQLAASKFFNDSGFYDREHARSMCPDGMMGCLNGCAKSYACKLREQQGKECLVLTLIDPFSDAACVYFPAVLANLNIPAYFCFIDKAPLQAYAVAMQQQHQPVFFYFWEPDVFFYLHPEVFDRVLLPQFRADRYALSTGTFGEHGYGMPTENPVDVDSPSMSLLKYASTLLTENDLLQFLVSQFAITDTDIDGMMRAYTEALARSETILDDPQVYFDVSCNWVKNNFEVWETWLKRLPLCDRTLHMKYEIHGCNASSSSSVMAKSSSSSSTSSGQIHTIEFSWKKPNPDNVSLPSECDGGAMTLPRPQQTSRSCAFLTANEFVWLSWITKKPSCDRSFYSFNVTDCDSHAKRTVHFFWWLPDPANLSQSLECEDSHPSILPQDLRIDCEYVPTSNAAFITASMFAFFLVVLYAAGIVFVYRFRDSVVIKHSQYEVLILMLIGGALMSAASVAYGGRPSIEICAWRPVLASLGYTTVFGALLLKCVRVYRIFSMKAMKRRVINKRKMLRWLMFLYAVDGILLVMWAVLDFPLPRYQSIQVVGLDDGVIDQLGCRSNSIVFSVLLIFWKAILLVLGGSFAFMIRKIPSDFQESFWIFSSVAVVVLASIVVLSMSYLVTMPATALFSFIAGGFLLGTLVVLALMMVPKLLQMRQKAEITIGFDDDKFSSLHKSDSQHALSSTAPPLAPSGIGNKATVGFVPKLTTAQEVMDRAMKKSCAPMQIQPDKRASGR